MAQTICPSQRMWLILSFLWRSHSRNCDIPSHLFIALRNRKTLFNDDVISSRETEDEACIHLFVRPWLLFFILQTNLISQHSTGATLNCITVFERAHSKEPHPGIELLYKGEGKWTITWSWLEKNTYWGKQRTAWPSNTKTSGKLLKLRDRWWKHATCTR